MDWSILVPHQEWKRYDAVLKTADEQKIPYALGGGLVFSIYTHRWRNTKDMDLFILPADRERMMQILSDAGFEDLYSKQKYDPTWIYRGTRDGVIIDLIWQMANHRAVVDESWLRRARHEEVWGRRLSLLAPEELIWAKMYVLQRDRCDWPDLLSMLYSQKVDWKHLLGRAGDDAPLLGGLLSLFKWLCPACAHRLPEWLWEKVGLLPPSGGTDLDIDHGRAAQLDIREWFGPS